MRMSAGLFAKAAFLAFVVTSNVALAEVAAKKKISEIPQLTQLRKITVGPDDQYQGVRVSSGKYLVFTHKSELSPHLQIQDLETGDVSGLLPITADSQEPAASNAGKIAFTYFKFDARGDICFLPEPIAGHLTFSDAEVKCLKRLAGDNHERSHPFWKSENELGYLDRDVTNGRSQVLVENLSTGEVTKLAEGKIWSPSMRQGGQYLVYNELLLANAKQLRRIRLLNLGTPKTTPPATQNTAPAATPKTTPPAMQNTAPAATQKTVALRFDLPGVSAFPSLSPDEKYLYFSHYLNDTNADNNIDGSDNAVIFRYKVADAWQAQPGTLPEQLTSVENNCNFPIATGPATATAQLGSGSIAGVQAASGGTADGQLLLTCDFEGSLDVYAMPPSGTVPGTWDLQRLLNAKMTSRSYAERALIAQTIRYRYPATEAQVDYDQELMNNHILAQDHSAAIYYLNKLHDRTKNSEERADLSALELWLQVGLLARDQQAGNLTREFRDRVQSALGTLASLKASVVRTAVIKQSLLTMHEDFQAAAQMMKSMNWSVGKASALNRYIYFQSVQKLAQQLKAVDLAAAYRQIVSAPEFDVAAQVYYASEWLSWIRANNATWPERLKVLQKEVQGLSGVVQTLFQAEAIVVRIILEKSEPAKYKIYPELDKIMLATKDAYDLRKALYVRAITAFAEAADFQFLELIGNNWLRYTVNSDTEYIYAREVVAQTSLDRGYASLAKGQLQFADNYFYGALSYTDDLESHSGHVRSLLLENQRAEIDKRYGILVKRGAIEENKNYVDALLLIMDRQRGPLGALDHDTKYLDQALEKLRLVAEDRNSPVLHLLMGYCLTQKFLLSAKGYASDESLLKLAHHELMLAYDLGRDNARVKASALTNLGLLQARAFNHGLAARFFALRMPLGFISNDEKQKLTWLYARELFLSRQQSEAIRVLNELPKELKSPAIRERVAFYLAADEKYTEAAGYYKELIEAGQVTGQLNLAKVNLNYGLCLLKMSEKSPAQLDTARAYLLKALAAFEVMAAPVPSSEDLLDFNRDRWLAIAHGLIAQTGGVAERVSHLRQRIDLLKKGGDKLVDQSAALIVEAQSQLAALLTEQGDLAAAGGALNESLESARAYGESSSFLGPVAVKTTLNFLAGKKLLRQGQSQPSRGLDAKQIGFIEQVIKAHDAVAIADPRLGLDLLKIKVLFALEQNQKNSEIMKLLSSDQSLFIKKALPKPYNEVTSWVQ